MKSTLFKGIGVFLYVIAFVLLLELVKTIVLKQGFPAAFLVATMLIAFQFLVITGYILLFCFYTLFFRLRLRRPWLFSVLCVFTFFVAMEWGYNSLLNHPRYIPSWLKQSFLFYYDAYDCNLIQVQKGSAVYDPGLFYTLKPSSSFYYHNREFTTLYQTNSKGVRDDEQSLQAPGIICLGDSYGMGWGVQQQETYAQRLEQLTGMKVLNAAVSSYGTAREMKQLERFDTSGLQYVIIQYCGNDYGENRSFIHDRQAPFISSRAIYDSAVMEHEYERTYFPGKLFGLITQLFLKQQVNKVVHLFSLPFGRNDALENLPDQAAAFLKVLNAGPIDFKKVKVIVTILESDVHKNNTFLTEVQKQLKQEPYRSRFAGQVTVLDLAPLLNAKDYFDLDLHIRADAHLKIAQKMQQAIRQNAR